ncbi:TPA: LysE family translocator [Yersinia enterocolitica]
MLDSAFISYVTVMSITPGPNNLLLAASGVNFGLRRTFPMMLGITFGCALQCALMTTLLAFILSWVGVVRLPLVTLGGGYLLWLSWKIFNSGTPNARDSEQPMGFIQGALFQAINPKAWLMAMNVAILFTPREGATLSHTLLIVGGFALLNLPCVAVWAVMGDQLRHALRVNWKLRLFNGVMGGLMAITALWLLVEEWLTVFNH